ncbi:MAG: zinc-ribbon domain-containing protein [Candidatus Bathyarchaeia archaeon]
MNETERLNKGIYERCWKCNTQLPKNAKICYNCGECQQCQM